MSVRKLSRSWMLAASLGCGALAPGLAAGQADVDAGVNAALRYWPVLHLRAMNPANQQSDPGAILSGAPGRERESAIGVVRASADDVDRLIEASRHIACDWGADLDEGPMLLLPHLNEMRKAARLVVADARLRVDAGDHGGAAERLAAALRMSRHVRGEDGTLIASLVSAATFTMVHDEVVRGLDTWAFDVDDRRVLREAAARLGGDDPFGMRGAIIAEREMFIGWMRRTYAAGAEMLPTVLEFGAVMGINQSDPNARAIQGMIDRGEDLEPQFRLLEGAYDAMMAAWDGPDAVAALQRVGDSARAGRYGPLAALVGPSLSKARQSHDKALALLVMLRARLGD